MVPAGRAGQPSGQLRITGTFGRARFSIHYSSSSFFQSLGRYAIRNEFRLVFAAVAGKLMT